ncbi:TonB family protein [Siphonobacter aquaeclarae]|uniref:TonB family C-terminal domain-containing protein n=1 Tax=Siphonobacter aquaeclarae TaxID=563176 RepID=A0A1G9NKP6_9BACT|nr:M56 family metallopeptidase [Siphonobacter aquaeclarae]SDL86940.1 TonB family C-terminal domain-containing protein [Siphonobacter aquaeclarae]
MNWLHYLLQVNLYLAGFYAFYRLLLRNETFHQQNRSFLLAGTALSFFIPVMQSDWVGSWLVTRQFNETLYQFYNPKLVFIRPDTFRNEATENPVMWGHLLAVFYLFGILFFLGKFAFQLRQLGQLFHYRHLKRSNEAYAFFSHFFVGKNLPNRHTIEAHERVHVRQLHSADVIFFELVAVFNWFNPVVYFLKRDVRLLHEYLADEVASREEASRADYAMLLFTQHFGVVQSELAHRFFNHSVLKQRVAMLKRRPSAAAVQYRYLMVLPLFGAMLFLSSASMERKVETVFTPPRIVANTVPETVYTLVEKQAVFPGGDQALYTFLGRHLKYPDAAIRAHVEGKVFLRFTIEKDGRITSPEVIKGIGFGCDAAALQVIRSFPKWQPAMHRGRVVSSRFNLPISFVLDSKK